MQVLDHLSDTAKHWIDVFSLGALVMALLDWIPGVTAILVMVWTGMRIYESFLAIRLAQKNLKRD